MDYLICHLGHLPRRYPSAFPVQNVGHVLKSESGFIRDRTFSSVNFSFILEGVGSYQVDAGPRIPVRAPCVLTQAPGPLFNYGPGPGQNWRELFFIFPGNTLSAWQENRIYDPKVNVWPIANIAAVEIGIQALLHSLDQRETEGMVDVIDRRCELLVLESRRSSPPRNLTPLHARLYQLRQDMDLHPERDWDFPRLARTCGCSYSTFRRDWKILFGHPPARHLTERRLQEARRLLVESNLSIAKISNHLGFEDPLYFSRRFRQYAGSTASEYRRIHQTVHGR